VNTIHPAAVETDINVQFLKSQKYESDRGTDSPRRIGQTTDVANVAAFLLSATTRGSPGSTSRRAVASTLSVKGNSMQNRMTQTIRLLCSRAIHSALLPSPTRVLIDGHRTKSWNAEA